MGRNGKRHGTSQERAAITEHQGSTEEKCKNKNGYLQQLDILLGKQDYGQLSQVNMAETIIFKFFLIYEIVHECMHYF